MKLEIAYGKTRLSFTIPDNAPVVVIESRQLPGLPDPAAALRAACDNPVESVPLSELVKPSDTVGIVFSDITRPTPNHLIIPALRDAMPQIDDSQILLFNATGTHRAQTDAELRGMLGNSVVDRCRIIQHNTKDRSAHACVGITPSGNEVWLQREFMDCDIRILTGFIEPHFFAGFSGGGKAVMPGLALQDTVQRNHSTAHIDCPRVNWGITHGNPLWEEIFAAASLAQPTFLVNVTLNRSKEITGIFAGDFAAAHAVGCAFVKETAMFPVAAPFDIVITSNSGYPLDLNVYQSVKGMSAAAQVVKKGGSIIIAADCWDGLPDDSPYAQLLSEFTSLDELLAAIRTPGFQRPEMWQAQIQALIAQRADIYIYSHHLSSEQIHRAHLRPCRNIEETLGELLRHYGPGATAAILPDGPQVIPYIKDEG